MSMGVYIKGIKLPKDEPGAFQVIVMYVGADGKLRAECEGIHEVVPVPPHGRCVDADRMLADNEIYYNQLGRPDGAVGARYQSVKRSIELASTIIPAEEEPNVPDP